MSRTRLAGRKLGAAASPRAASKFRFTLAACLVACQLGCAGQPKPSTPGAHPEAAPPPAQRATLILIGLDGFRWDFLEHGATPTLSDLATQGVHADRLIPSFPTKTFPNHYTIVTGLRPSEHGLVANNILDPRSGERFGLSNREAVRDGKWYGGEPIWVTAERQGVKTAPLFWPGSEAEIGGARPTYSAAYDGSMSPEDRVDRILEWLDLPPPDRPGFLTLYLSDVDSAAHRYGPEPSVELAAALDIADGAVARLLQGLERRGLETSVDLLIVSDHGMSAISPDRIVFLEDYIDPEEANVVDWSPILGLWPPDEAVDRIYNRLSGAHPKLSVYRRDEIPSRFEFFGHERIPRIVGISAEGWNVTTRAELAGCPDCFSGGSHGYDQRLESMGALLIASGPSFRRGAQIAATENYHLYNLMCAVLGLEPAPNSGDPERISDFLAPGFTVRGFVQAPTADDPAAPGG